MKRPDAVLLDLHLKGSSGRDILPEIRSRLPGAIIVVLSAEVADAAQFLREGADAFVDKMEPMSAIAGHVVNLLEQSTLPGVAPEPAAGDGDVAVQRTSGPTAAAAGDVIDALIGTLVHELRTPLTVIRGFASTLNLSADRMDADTVKKSALAIERQTEALTEALSRLADARSLRAGFLTLAAADVDLGPLLSAYARDTVSVEIDGDLRLHGDGERLDRTLRELIANATQFSDGQAVSVRATRDGDRVVVEIQDRGQGMPEGADGEVLYEAFRRANTDRKGTGIGLFLARGLAEAHGGTVTHRRAGEGGTILTLELPAA